MKLSIFLLLCILLFTSCKKEEKEIKNFNLNKQIEAITVLGDTIYSPNLKKDEAFKNYENAKQKFENSQNNADSLIWYGRRIAYLGYFKDAIEIFTKGIKEFPNDARMYRHRGHRYLSTRQFDKAISDFEKAVTLIEGKTDRIEPDGLPNSRNIPLSTLHGNIWYHLGLAYYLNNDMENALSAYSNRTVTEKYPDNLVSGGYWLYMINRRLGNEEAANLAIKNISTDMDIIENNSYHTMCLFYKGIVTEDIIANDSIGNASSDVLSYGLGNWYLFEKQDTLKTKQIYNRLLEKGNPFSFAYLAAESDWKRLFSE